MIRKILEIFGRHHSVDMETTSGIRFIDLGLPSGTLWAESDVETPVMQGCSLPTFDQAQELITCCDFYITTRSDGRKFYRAQGPSGQSVLFPIEDYDGTPGQSGCCWCGESPGSSQFAYFLLLSEVTMTIGIGRGDMRYPYRMVRI